jgi:predicted HD superfamily hydrolase involved in NAD metabolism
MMSIAEAEELVAGIPARRAAHSRRVAETAAGIAARWSAPADEARIAGLLHDYCRDWSADELLAAAERSGLRTTPLECARPRQLLHGAVAARELVVYDLPAGVLEAIAVHTTGAAGMGPVARCVYVADFCEPGREIPVAAEVRELAERSLDEALALTSRLTLEHLIASRRALAQGTVDLYNELHG